MKNWSEIRAEEGGVKYMAVGSRAGVEDVWNKQLERKNKEQKTLEGNM